MKPPKHYDRQTFISLFNSIARHKHRYAVFSDFVTMSAIAYHNAVNKLETLENVSGVNYPDRLTTINLSGFS